MWARSRGKNVGLVICPFDHLSLEFQKARAVVEGSWQGRKPPFSLLGLETVRTQSPGKPLALSPARKCSSIFLLSNSAVPSRSYFLLILFL